MNALFNAIDTNRSGGITLEEFQLALRVSLRTQQSEQLIASSRGTALAPLSKRPQHEVIVPPSPRNRVGRVGPFVTVSPRTIILPPLPAPIVISPRGGSREQRPLSSRPSSREYAFRPARPPDVARPSSRFQRPQSVQRPRLQLKSREAPARSYAPA